MRINLIPVERRPLKQNHIRWQFVVILIGVIMLIAVSSMSLLKQGNVKALRLKNTAAKEYTDLLKSQASAVQQLKDHAQDLKQRLDSYQQATASTSREITDMINLVIGNIPESIWVEKVELDPKQILIEGYTWNFASINLFLQNLDNNGLDASIRDLQEIPELSLTSFIVSAQRGDTGE